jgi:hypothetical protein
MCGVAAIRGSGTRGKTADWSEEGQSPNRWVQRQA